MSVGTGHSGSVAAVRISPDRKIIVSVGSEGGIFIWGMLPPSCDAHASGSPGRSGATNGCNLEAAAAAGGNLNINKMADDVSRVSMSR